MGKRRTILTLSAVVPGLMMMLGLSLPARAQNSSTLGSVDPYPNFTTVGVTVNISGDDNQDAVASFVYRPAGTVDWFPGHALSRLDPARFVGSLFYLDPDTEYEVMVSLDDPDNAAVETLTVYTTTRVDTPPPAGGGDIYVDPSGDDGNPGTQAQPLRTIQAGADAAQPGDTVHVMPGIYYEAVSITSGGEAGNPIVFVAEGPGVVISGADQDLAENGAVWTDAGDGIYWVPFTGTCVYLAADDERIYDYGSLADLTQENGRIGIPGALPGGFFVDAGQGRLYLRLPDRSHPDAHVIYAAVRDRGILMDGVTDVVIRGFEIRHFGSVAIDVRDTARSWVRQNQIHHVGAGIRVRRPLSHENVVEDNHLLDTSVYFWPWDSCKGETPEASAISIVDGEGNVARRNTVQGFFNGIYTGAWATTDESIARNTDVYENVIFQIGDDGLEPEGACVNNRFIENTIVEVFNAISLAPIETGPTWLVRNLVVNFKSHVLKINNGTPGYVFVYHTTSVPHPNEDGAQPLSPSVPFGNIVTRNNIWVSNRYVIEYIPTSLIGPIDWDYDALWTYNTDGGSRFAKWFDVRYGDLAEFQGGTGLELNGFQEEPVYEDAANGDYTLTEGNPLLDVGEVINGINDRFNVDGPDIGAFERGGIIPGPDDGGVPWPDGGGVQTDAGPRPDGSTGGTSSKSGCSCRITDSSGDPVGTGFPALLIALFLVALIRKRSASG